MRRPRGRILSAHLTLIVTLGLLVGLLVGLPSAGRAALPVPLPTSPAGDPPGANDWACVPTAARPTPVILVHGTFGDRRSLLEGLSMAIKAAGHCVYSLDYGNRGTGEIAESSRQLKRFVRRVRRATGATKVSMVGHSQGGMMPRHYIRFRKGAKRVDDLIGIAPSNHGTDLVGGFAPLAPLTGPVLDLACRACAQQASGSAFLRRLNQGDETPGRVSYTQITTRLDQVVVPHTSGYLAPGRRTTNVTIQDKCPGDLAEHILIPTSRTTIAIVLDALGRRGPARKRFSPPC